MAVLEVFLAIVLVYIVMNQIQINLPAKYSDTSNMDRLHRYSHDIAFSICGSLDAKRAMVNDSLAFDLNNSIPSDVCYRLSVYKNSSNTHLLDSLVYNYTPVSQTSTAANTSTVELLYDEFSTVDGNWTGWGAAQSGWNITSVAGPADVAYNRTTTISSAVANRGTFYLVRSLNLSGYRDINISFWGNTTANDAGEGLSVSYWDGWNWTGVFTQEADPISWNYTSIMLDAQDNPDFKINISCTNGQIAEYCYIDTLRITGRSTGNWTQTVVSNNSPITMFAIGDTNNDGKIEVVGGGNQPQRVAMYENKTGTWVETNISGNLSGGGVEQIAVGDVDNDGKNETIIYITTTNGIRMYKNVSGGWNETNITTPATSSMSLAIGDANNDGSNEIVLGMTSFSYEVRMYKYSGGTWVETNITDKSTGTRAIIGDVDNDGYNEVVTDTNGFAKPLRAYEYSAGSWVETNISNLGASDYIMSMAIGDANNDGQNDLVIGLLSGSNTLRMYECNAGGGCTETNISSPGQINSVAIGDANNDGQNEVVIGLTTTSGDDIRMYKYNGFSWAEAYISDSTLVAGGAGNIRIGDVNNDGKNEVVAEVSSANIRVRAYAYTYVSSSSIYCSSSDATPSATSSCLIAGGPNATNYSVSVCNNGGSSCLSSITSSDNSRINLMNNENFTVGFSPTKNGSMVEFFLEGYHNQSGTTFLYDSGGSQIAAYNFSTSADENHVFDLTDFFPDPNGIYNVTVAPNVNASYDYAYLNVSSNVYSPRRVVVQTWNYGG